MAGPRTGRASAPRSAQRHHQRPNFWQMREISCENAIGRTEWLARPLRPRGRHECHDVAHRMAVGNRPGAAECHRQPVPHGGGESELQSDEHRPAFTGATKDASGSQLSFTEPAAGARYILEASTDLVNWTKLMARTSTGVTHQLHRHPGDELCQSVLPAPGAVAAQGVIFLPGGRTAGFGGESRVAAKTRQER